MRTKYTLTLEKQSHLCFYYKNFHCVRFTISNKPFKKEQLWKSLMTFF